MADKCVDYAEFTKMVDLFMDAGFNYFDTARGYLGGQSEIALRECLTSRYPRDSYILTDKLSDHLFSSSEEIRPLVEDQLRVCGVEYFDFYLMHAQTAELFKKYKECRAYEQAFEMKREGLLRHVGISFHDRAEVLEEILSEYPDIEVVQLQLNYADMDDPAVQSRKCSEVCIKHGKPIIVMEPVKGGNLANLPEDAARVIERLNAGSSASYAIRYAAGSKGVEMVLSGMSSMEQLTDNISYMKDFRPLDENELRAIEEVCEIFKSKHPIQCTACRYCIDGCPKHISIPDIFSCVNAKRIYNDWNSDYYYGVHTKHGGKASECIKCGKCERACPQHLPIRSLLEDAASEFEKNN